MNKKLIVAVIAVCALVGLFLGFYVGSRPDVQEGTKAFTVTVVHGDGTSKEFSYRTDAQLLGAYLEKEGLIDSQGADEGMFHTVDGEKADWNVNQSYWSFYLGDDYAMEGVYTTVIEDGAAYRLVYTLG